MTNSIAFLGVMSSGKDVMGIKFLLDCIKHNPMRVISNCWINIPNIKILTTEQLYEQHRNPEFFRDSYLYITEMHTILESRSSSALINKNFTMFLTQIGKLGCKVIYTSQLQGQIDLRLREWTPYMIICERFVMRNGKLQKPNFYDGRKLKEQIYISMTLAYVDISGQEIYKPMGMYKPKQSDFDVYNTEEIIMMDRERYMSKR